MKRSIISLSLIFSLFHLSMASATSILPLTLEQLSSHATLIFYGEVTDNQVKQDEQGNIATYTEFKIIDRIKGNAKASHTIKQIGGQLKSQNINMRVHGVPKFHVGRSYVVFLPDKSSLGFSSPLGLHQGRYTVTSINGEQIISNGNQLNSPNSTKSLKSSLTIPLAVRADNPTQARLGDFINTVRSYTAQ